MAAGKEDRRAGELETDRRLTEATGW